MPTHFTTNLSEVTQLEGVYAVEVAPPAPARTPGADWLGYVGRFAWGPVGTPVVIDSQGQYLDTFAPAGLGYSTTGHRGIARAQPAQLKIVRVGGTGFSPPAAPTVTPSGTPGVTSYSYRVVAVAGTKVTDASAAGSTTTGNATLTGSDFNRVAWSAPAGAVGVTEYRVYRSVGGATQGLIGTVAVGTTQFDDTGLAAAGSVPAQNTTQMAAASMILQTAGGANILNVSAKHPGDLGGQITITIAAADDAVAAHFNLTATLGTESETYRNLQTLSGLGGVVLGSQTSSKFLAQLTAVTGNLGGSTRPVNGTYTLGVAASNVDSPIAGSDGITLAADYTGTAGDGDAGLARFEGDPDVTLVASDDCSTTHRVAVNSALVDHAVANNRMAVIFADSGTDLADTITHVTTNAAAYRDERAIFAWPWAYTLDETGSEVLVPPSAFVAGALTHMPRHLGSHWKDPRNTRWYSKIARLEYTLGRSNLILAKNAGIEVLVQTDAGGIAPKSGVTTSLVTGQQAVARRRLTDFIAKGLTSGQEVYEGGPLDAVTRGEQLARAKAFLQGLKDAGQRGEAAITEAIEDYSVTTISSGADLAAGLHKIAVRVKSFATQDFIAFLLTVGPAVAIEETLAAA